MKNYCAISDLHLLAKNPSCRRDDLTEVQWGKLNYLFAFAAQNSADILVAGDINNTSNNYHILNRLADIIEKYRQKVKVYVVFGQHDLRYRNPEDTNLQILASAGLVTVLGSKPESISTPAGEHQLFGANWMDGVPDCTGYKLSFNILVIHDSINTAPLFPGQKINEAEAFLKENKFFSHIICGDIHRTFFVRRGSRFILNSGPLLRKEADEYNIYHHKPGFFFFDVYSDKVRFEVIPHRPAEEVISREHIEKKKVRSEAVSRADTATFLHELQQRASNRSSKNIRDRIRARLEDRDSAATNDGVAEILEQLLNGTFLKTAQEN